MSANKMKFVPTMKNSIDYYNFCTANNDLPILKILSERFCRAFRVSLSNHLRMITNIQYSDQKLTFGDWIEDNQTKNCMFVINFQKFSAPIVVKLDRKLAYGAIDVLTGGDGLGSLGFLDKEMTCVEMGLLREVGEMIVNDLNTAWGPIHSVKAKLVRSEVNPQFIGAISPQSKLIQVLFNVSFNGVEGQLEILYPYSTLFPMRNELFSSEC